MRKQASRVRFVQCVLFVFVSLCEVTLYAQSPPLGPSLVTLEAGTRKNSNTKLLNFASGCTLTTAGTQTNVTCTGSASGTVTSISQGTGITNTPNPITTTGTVAIDQSFSPTWTGAHTWAPTLDIRPVIIKQTTAGSPTLDIFDVTASNGTTKYLSVDKNGNLYSVNLDATTGATFTLGGTNATGVTVGKAGVALTVPGGILATTYDKAAAGTLSIGLSPGNATAISIAASGINTTFGGAILVGGIVDRSSAATLSLGTLNASAVTVGSSSITVSFPGNVNLNGDATNLGNGSGDVTTLTGTFKSTNALISTTAPTISSGFGTGPSISTSNGTASFRINVGTGGSATSGVIGLPTATTGWNCFCNDITTQSSTVFLCKQTASATTTATIGNFDAAGAAAAWTASDIVAVSCFGL